LLISGRRRGALRQLFQEVIFRATRFSVHELGFPGWLGSRPRRFELAAGPASMLDRCTECRPGPTFSFGVIPAKNKNAFLQDLSFQKLPSYGTNFTLVA
jgi:hypothetical protein